jgi:hypothetical protein
MSLPISFDLRNLYVPNTSQVDYPDTHLDLLTLRDALNNFAGVFSSVASPVFSGSAIVGVSLTPNVGIGNTAPSAQLHIGTATSGSQVLAFSHTALTAATLDFRNVGAAFSDGWIQYNPSISGFRFGINGVERARLTSSILNMYHPESNIYISGDPATGGLDPGMRIHFSTSSGVGVIDSNYNTVFRNGAGTPIFATVPSRLCIALVARSGTPAGVADGDIWYDSAAGKFRGRAAGATVDFH